MIFLIQFDRSAHRIVLFRSFKDARREESVRCRLELEIEVARDKLDHEVVLLEAQSEEHIRQTHRRYFEHVDKEDVEKLVTELDKAATR